MVSSSFERSIMSIRRSSKLVEVLVECASIELGNVFIECTNVESMDNELCSLLFTTPSGSKVIYRPFNPDDISTALEKTQAKWKAFRSVDFSLNYDDLMEAESARFDELFISEVQYMISKKLYRLKRG